VFRDVTRTKYTGKWPRDIEEHLGICKILVAVWSKAAKESNWVKDEMVYFKNNGKKIIIVNVDNTPIPPLFSTIDTIKHRNLEKTIKELFIKLDV